MTEGVPSSSSDRFSHPSLGSRSARSAAAAMEDGRQLGGGGQQQQAGKKRMMRDHAGATSARGPATGGGAHKKASTSSSTGTSNHTGMAAASSSSAAEGGGGGPGGANRNSSSARPSRSSQETTTGSSSETETDAERMQPSRPGTSGTLRSMQSMPLLTPLQQHHLVQQQQQAGYNPVLAAAGGIYGIVGMHPGMMAHPAQLHAAAAAAAAAAAGNPTWNGEPCPVHGSGIHPAHHQMPIAHYQTPHGTIAAYPQPLYSSMSMKRAASIHEMAMATPLPAIMPPPPPPHHGPIYGTLPHPGHGGGHHQFLMPPPPSHEQPTHFVMMTTAPSSMIHGPPASSLGGRRTRQQGRSGGGPGSLPPMPAPSQMATMQRQGRPLVVNGKNGQPEPLPVRHDAPPLPPKIPPSDVASKTASRTSSAAKPFSYNACCKGNVVVLWVILGIIGLGVVLAIVFYYAFQ
ncbi:hypothetical protein DAPPUDRAFT_101102 [Daphnia pulex]|uniref:Uncharacterized protein n=1 Tax=Daphnia pulex TaxID=6669 RepID=E9GCC7_DAPPU|nr:hypothetical protein DAPPUDRAFT_101102 [Daphnia pulex]|eukprot:EFX82525.1 hypothetical protein DAPPUDRAFT_101102 [Daphnia pulex]